MKRNAALVAVVVASLLMQGCIDLRPVRAPVEETKGAIAPMEPEARELVLRPIPEPETEPETKPETETETEAELEVETEPELVTQAEIMSEAEPKEEVIYLEPWEKELLLHVVMHEAEGEDTTGKLLVAATVVNRILSSNFPDDIWTVVTEGYFPVEEVPFYDDNDPIVQEAMGAVERALQGEDPFEEVLGSPTLYFYNPAKTAPGMIEKISAGVAAAGGVQIVHGLHTFFGKCDWTVTQ